MHWAAALPLPGDNQAAHPVSGKLAAQPAKERSTEFKLGMTPEEMVHDVSDQQLTCMKCGADSSSAAVLCCLSGSVTAGCMSASQTAAVSLGREVVLT